MASRDRKAPTLTDAERAQILQNLVPIRKDAELITKGNERLPMVSVRTPALGSVPLHGAALIQKCARNRNLETEYPPAIRIHKSAVNTYVVGEPLSRYDPNLPDQYELNWDSNFKSASINLLAVLQPRNLEVAAGYVMEIPITLESMNAQHYILFHLGEAVTREEEEGPPRKKKAPDPSSNAAVTELPKEPE